MNKFSVRNSKTSPAEELSEQGLCASVKLPVLPLVFCSRSPLLMTKRGCRLWRIFLPLVNKAMNLDLCRANPGQCDQTTEQYDRLELNRIRHNHETKY